MAATPTEAAAIVRQGLCDWAAYERDEAVLAVLRELIRACDPARRMILMRDKAAIASVEYALLAGGIALAVLIPLRHLGPILRDAIVHVLGVG